ncbi:hypothetical protein BGW38_001771 [Lunasporangiospora selenospora]|uniref:Peptidase family S41 n=1 Tax=Lunasporangiospora selenospora TaxID=979761 RepID=A0A9P6KHV3_9FUNG|nr:hypothetical protein BGW38_001771 [Lunasporangiospora selenospora]
MVLFSFKAVILSLSVASLAFSAAARETLESLTTFFDDYYISRDSSLTRRLAKPLEADPVDIVAELKKIGRRQYTSDRQFHTDLFDVVASLHDGHAIYGAHCYIAYMFLQPIQLYAPVINGKQVLKVYKDSKNRGYEDCTVLTIDGKNAMHQVRKRASLLGNAKDPNVRLNEALVSMKYNLQTGSFEAFPGQFALRIFLPEKPTMRYELQCAGQKKRVVVEDEWTISPQVPFEFKDTESFIKNICLSPTGQPSNGPTANALTKRDQQISTLSHGRDRIHTLAKRVLNRAFAAPTDSSPNAPPTPPVYPEAIKIAAGAFTAVYQLKDRPTVGVIVFVVGLIDFREIEILHQALETLYSKGVTNLIIDVVSGDGGYANIGPDFAQLFFPSKSPLEKITKLKLRISPAIRELSAKVFNSTNGGRSDLGNMMNITGGAFYDASQFFDIENNRLYTNNSLYTDGVTEVRNGRKATYTKLTAYRPATYPPRPNQAKYPWTSNADRIRIVTDGRCLSACAHAIYSLSNQYKVPTYGIGGTYKEPLSKFQYAAAGAFSVENFSRMFKFGNMTSPVKPVPYAAVYAVTLAEFNVPSSNLPLEFDGAQHATDYRLNFDPVNARSKEALWSQVAQHAWK